MIKMIFLQSQDGFIGRDNGLLFNIPEDMRYFREQTKGATVVMGRKTWESLPSQFRPLPGRANVVLTTSNDNIYPDQVEVVNNITELKEIFKECKEDIWVIGGEKAYNLCMPWVEEIHQTVVFENKEGDTKAPIIVLEDFTLIQSSEIKHHNGLDFQINVYKRTNHGNQIET